MTKHERQPYEPQPGKMGTHCAYCKELVEEDGVRYDTGFIAHETCHEEEVTRLQKLRKSREK